MRHLPKNVQTALAELHRQHKPHSALLAALEELYCGPCNAEGYRGMTETRRVFREYLDKLPEVWIDSQSGHWTEEEPSWELDEYGCAEDSSDWWYLEPRELAVDALGAEFVRLYE